jgi:hypothetical protein
LPPQTGWHASPHRPVDWLQTRTPSHVPQEPPHPSDPQVRPSHDGVQPPWHRPTRGLHVAPLPHSPQVPPHPSVPQFRPSQDGAQQASDSSLQKAPSAHPHRPPQPSLPQVFPSQAGVHDSVSAGQPTSAAASNAVQHTRILQRVMKRLPGKAGEV